MRPAAMSREVFTYDFYQAGPPVPAGGCARKSPGARKEVDPQLLRLSRLIRWQRSISSMGLGRGFGSLRKLGPPNANNGSLALNGATLCLQRRSRTRDSNL